jgi:hypothetical protein
MLKVVVPEPRPHVSSLHFVDHEGKLILRLHLLLPELRFSRRMTCPPPVVEVQPAVQYRNCRVELLPPVADEIDPHAQ